MEIAQNDLNTTNTLKLFKPAEVLNRAQTLLQQAEAGDLAHARVDLSRLGGVLLNVLEITKETYPDFQIPPYGAWRAFEPDGLDRWGALAGARAFESADEMLVSAADLACLACVMKTMSPEGWVYEDPMTGTKVRGSQASGIAAFHMFAAGSFSSDMSDPYRVDADTLIRLEPEELAFALQWDPETARDLVEAMRRHLKRFGEALALRPDLFSEGEATRPGLLALKQAAASGAGVVSAAGILDLFLGALAPVWEGGAQLGDIVLGDSFHHSVAKVETAPAEGADEGPDDTRHGLDSRQVVPFHLAAQDMVYSLIEPFAWAGFEVSDLEQLTGPADDAHAALFVDAGVLQLRTGHGSLDAEGARDRMIELRALTLALTGMLADLLRQELDVPPDQLPLTCILEGGTSRLGHRILQQSGPEVQKLGRYLNPGAVFWLPFGA